MYMYKRLCVQYSVCVCVYAYVVSHVEIMLTVCVRGPAAGSVEVCEDGGERLLMMLPSDSNSSYGLRGEE